MVGVGQAMEVQHRHRCARPTGVDAEAAGLQPDRHDPVRQLAGQAVGQDRPIRVPGCEHATRIDGELRGHQIDQEPDVPHIVDLVTSGRAAAVATVPRLQPGPVRHGTNAIGVDDDEAVRLGQLVEP